MNAAFVAGVVSGGICCETDGQAATGRVARAHPGGNHGDMQRSEGLDYESRTDVPFTVGRNGQIPLITDRRPCGMSDIVVSPNDRDAAVPAPEQDMGKDIRVV